MKRVLLTLIALTVGRTECSHAAMIYSASDGSSVDLYGRLGFNISDKKTGHTSGGFDGRIGFSGRQIINEHLAVIGLAQYQMNAAEYANNISAENPHDLTARYVWAGMDLGEYGRLTGGRVTSGLIMFTDIGDVFASSDVAVARQAKYVDPTAVQVFRQDGTVQYQNSFSDFDFSVAWIPGNDSSDLDYGYNTALRYTFDMGNSGRLQPVIAGQVTKAGHSNTSRLQYSDADKFTFYGLGTRYYLGDVTLGLLYGRDNVTWTDHTPDSTDRDYETTLVWNVSPDWVFRTGYRHLKNKGGDGLQLRDTTFEVQYKLTRRSSVFASYSWRNGEKGKERITHKMVSFGGSDPSKDYFHLGLRYEF